MRNEIMKAFEEKWFAKYGKESEMNLDYWHIREMIDEAVHTGLVNEASKMLPVNANPLLNLMHDTAHDLDQLSTMSSRMGVILKETKEPKMQLWVIKEYIESSWKSIRNQLDLFYVRSKKLEADNQQNENV